VFSETTTHTTSACNNETLHKIYAVCVKRFEHQKVSEKQYSAGAYQVCD